MNCPICSDIVAPSQNYCRTCGFGFELTERLVTEQLPGKADETLLRKKNKLERLGVAALSVFGTGVLGFLLYLIGHKLMIAQGKILAALGILAFILIIGCGLLSIVLFRRPGK